MDVVSGVLDAGVRLVVPVLLAGLGELVSERSGVINIGLEGKMAAGAFTGYMVIVASGDPWAAAVAAIVAGMCVSAVVAGLSIWGRANQILVGFAVFVMVPGLMAFFYQQYVTTLAIVPALPRLDVPVLSGVPVIGKAFFSQNGFYYAAIAASIGIWVVLRFSRYGLLIGACGHNPEVAQARGISVRIVRSAATLACGALAGLGGAALTVGALGSFSSGVIGGRGFMAIAIVILGRWKVGWVVLAALAVGVSDALRLRLGYRVEFPVQLMAMAPWLVVLTMLIIGARYSVMPRALGRNFGR